MAHGQPAAIRLPPRDPAMNRSILIGLYLALSLPLPSQAAEVGAPAPSCTAQALDGGAPLPVGARPGQVVLVDFWASWCPPCLESFPFLEQMQQELGDQGFKVIAISLDEELGDARAFARKQTVSFSLGRDGKGDCPKSYGVKAMPSSYLIDRQGRLRQVHLGFKSGDKAPLRRQLEALLAEPGGSKP
jgi:thiol-disulfide isomerase/thioredoxin